VKRDSNIREAKDLRGRRVGFAKGTSAHTLVLHFVDKNGLSLSDIVPVYLAPADGRVALEAGSIDAWSIWDPYLAAAERQGGLRELSNGRGYVEGREFYLASKNIADHDPQLLREFLDQLVRVKAWAKARPSEVNGFLAAETGIELNAVELAESRRNRYDTESLSAALIASQQSLADRYLELGLLPKKIDVKADVLELKP
jgi:sulfonate transport system substrate-binding protein